jgi:solute carrier family 25 iron transporter 28/37
MAPDDASDADLDYLEEFDPDRGIPLATHLVAGSGAGLAEHLFVFPLDTVKTHAQCVGSCGRTQVADIFCLKHARQLVNDGLTTGTGARRLWRGVSAVSLACAPAHALYFGAFEAVRMTEKTPSHATNALAGAVAVIGHDALMTPADVLKQRLQLGHHRGLWDAWTHSMQHGGLQGLYRSLPTTLAMNIPYGCVSVAANEALKAKLKRGQEPLGVGSLLACGGLAGAVASLATTPLDVVKTRLQTQHLTCSLGAASAAPPPSARGMATLCTRPNGVAFAGFHDAATHIWRADGAIGFYRGAAVRALAQSPGVAITWTTYELFVRMLAPQ